MAQASGQQIALWSIKAGWAGLDLRTAVAVGMATGGYPDAPNGVWGVPGGGTDGQAQANAARAVQLSQGWGVFPTHRTGRWLLFIPQAEVAIATTVAPAIPGVIKDEVPGVKQVTDAATTAGQATAQAGRLLTYIGQEEFWTRAMKWIIGGALLVVASASLAKTTAGDPLRRFIFQADRRIAEGAIIAEMGGRGRVINVPQASTPRAPSVVRTTPRRSTAAATQARTRAPRPPFRVYDGSHRGYGMSRNREHAPRHAAPALTPER